MSESQKKGIFKTDVVERVGSVLELTRGECIEFTGRGMYWTSVEGNVKRCVPKPNRGQCIVNLTQVVELV